MTKKVGDRAIDVNGPHVAILMGNLFAEIATIFDDPEWGGLRQSHMRVLETLADDGSRLTDVARYLRMTKQGAGQLVTTLLDQELVEQGADPVDGRAKVLMRTERGDEVVRRVHAALDAIERVWADRVGEADYAAFRSVLARVNEAGQFTRRASSSSPLRA